MELRIIPKDEVVQNKCTVKEYIEKVRKRRKYHADYSNEYQKKKAACRNNNLDPNGQVGKGYITEVLVAKFLGINYPGYDILDHKDLGKINVKGSILSYNGNCVHHFFGTNKNKKADLFFCVGYDYEMKHVISIYIIPNDNYVSTLNSITIPYDSNSKWNEFKESEDYICKLDELFHTLKLKGAATVLRA